MVADVSAAFGVTGRSGVWATTVYVKLRMTGLDDPEVVPDVLPEVVDVLEPVEPLDELELELDVDDVDEPDEPVLDVEEPLEPVVPVLEVEDAPAFLVVLEVVPVAAVPVVPLVVDAVPCVVEPPAAEPLPWLVLLDTPFPVPVVAPVPPTRPIKAST